MFGMGLILFIFFHKIFFPNQLNLGMFLSKITLVGQSKILSPLSLVLKICSWLFFLKLGANYEKCLVWWKTMKRYNDLYIQWQIKTKNNIHLISSFVTMHGKRTLIFTTPFFQEKQQCNVGSKNCVCRFRLIRVLWYLTFKLQVVAERFST